MRKKSSALFLKKSSPLCLKAKRQIRKLQEPALECIDRVHSELLKIMLEMDGGTVATQFPHLAEKIMESGQKMLRKTTGPTGESFQCFFLYSREIL